MANSVGESVVAFRHHSGAEVCAGLLRLNRYVAAFEVYTPALGLCLSDVLADFRISAGERTLYSGRGVITAIVNTGPMLVCEAALDEAGFRISSTPENEPPRQFQEFLDQWQKVFRVRSDFKVAMADMSTLLWDLRLWLDQVELEIRSAPVGNRLSLERAAVDRIAKDMTDTFNEIRDELERISDDLDEETRPAHQSFCRRQLHSLLMCSPFAYRTFHKPLGYAGDYEMVNMMLLDPFQGASTYAKALNACFLSQWPAEAHRNRIVYLKKILEQESLRQACRGKPARILNLGCGPAHEVVRFMTDSPASDFAQFTLLDFNDETLRFAQDQLERVRTQNCRRTQLAFQKKSVQQLIKESTRTTPGRSEAARYDVVYCAGLFDYLTERTCKQLMGLFYSWLEPGGLLVATNVDDTKPFRNMMEFMLDWHLIYRNTAQAQSLMPEAAHPEDCSVLRDVTGVNVFMEARKPSYA